MVLKLCCILHIWVLLLVHSLKDIFIKLFAEGDICVFFMYNLKHFK